MMKNNLKKLNREVIDVVRERIKLLQANISEIQQPPPPPQQKKTENWKLLLVLNYMIGF